MSLAETSPASSPLPPLACIILAAGKGTRMKSALPKVLHRVAGKPLVRHVVDACAALSPEKIVVVVAPDSTGVAAAVEPHRTVVQPVALGTGDAVRAAETALGAFAGDVLVVFGDTPLVTATALVRLRARRAETGAAVVVSGFTPHNPAAYGRLVVDQHGHVQAIVEAAEATPAQAAIRLCNGGMMLLDGGLLWDIVARIDNKNSKGEYYLTDAIIHARAMGHAAVVAEMAEDDVMGINTRAELAAAERVMQNRLRYSAMLAGVTMHDPDTVYLSMDTAFGTDVIIGPHVVFGEGVRVGNNVEIRAFCHLEKTVVEDGASIGPFARTRPTTVVGQNAHIGNFVELKNTTVAAGAKINHLSYIGDAAVGAAANIGAGTITCNYDGYTKSKTEIGARAFVGSNSALIAPVTIGDGAYVGAGSVITNNVPPDTLAVARGRQFNLDGWAQKFRKEKEKK